MVAIDATKIPASTTSFDQICREITNEYFGNLRSLGYQLPMVSKYQLRQAECLVVLFAFASKHHEAMILA